MRLAALAATGLLVVVALGVALLFDGAEPDPVSTTGGPYAGGEAIPGIPLPAFSLRDESGRTVSSESVRGKVVALTFLDAQCTDACPVIGEILARGIDALTPAERRRVVAIAISVDPAEDTEEARRAFLVRHRAIGRIRYLSAPLEELVPLWKEFQILATAISGDDSLHSAPVRIYSRDGQWLATLHAGADLSTANLVHDLRVALGRAD